MEPITYSGTWSGSIATDKSIIELDRFVAKDSGEHVVSVVMTSSNFGSQSFGIYITVNSETVAQNQNYAAPNEGSISTTWTGNLSPGDVVGFDWSAANDASSGNLNWNIEATPTSTDPGPDPEEPGDGSLPANAFSAEGIEMVYFGAEEAQALYRGSLLVWEAIVDLYPEANIWLPFTDATALIKNEGKAGTLPFNHIGGSITHDVDHAWFSHSGRLQVTPPADDNGWGDGYTFSVWLRDIQRATGWQAILFRGPTSGTIVNETYVVLDTQTLAAPFSGLRFGSTHREFHSGPNLETLSGWAHFMVTWRRTSDTTFTCSFYSNGVLRGVHEATGYKSTDRFSNDSIVLGASNFSSGMDDIAIWDRPLSDEEARMVYEQGRSMIPTITTPSLAELTLDEYYYFTLDTNFSPDTWSATGLPAGITISNDGSLSGTPSIESSGTMTVTASGGGKSAEKSFSWVVASNTLVPHSASNSGSLLLGNNVWGIIYSHTVQGNGDGYLFADWTFGSTAFYFGSHTDMARLRVNGEVVMSRSVSRQATSWSSSGSSPVMRFNAGDVVTLEGLVSVSNSNLRTVTAWSFFLYRS